VSSIVPRQPGLVPITTAVYNRIRITAIATQPA
jgi:hypothetical protein